MRTLHAVAIGVFAAAVPGLAAAGERIGATVHVTVVDAAGAPIAAEILSSDQSAARVIGRTNAAGEADLSLTGLPLLIARHGSRLSAPVAPHDGAVRLVLALTEIARVVAKPGDPFEPLVSQTSAAAVAFDDVAAARSLVPNYRSQREGGSGQQTLNGVPLDLPTGPRGAAGDEPGVPSDLIDSFTATQADDGTVTPNYHLLSPTAATRVRFAHGIGADDTSLWKFGISGTAHHLGYALAAATGANNGALAGTSFTDISGRRYDHSTDGRHTDVSLSLSQAIGTTQINAAGFATRRIANDIDATMPGAVALGSGPGNATTGTTAFEYVVASQTHGRDSFHLIDSRFAGGSEDDARNALLAGQSTASVSGYRYSGGYDELSMTRSYGTASLTAKATLTHTSTTGYLADSPFAAANAIAAGQSTLGLAYERNHGRRSYGIAIDEARRSGDFGGSGLEARAHFKTTIAGTVLRIAASHAQAQTQEAYSTDAYNLAAPSTAAVTCDRPSATVTGPSQTSGRHPQSDTLDVSAHHAFRNGAAITAGGFVSAGRDMLVFPASQLGASLDTAYRSALAADFALVCPGESLTANDIYVAHYQSVAHLTGREWFADGTIPAGPLRLELSYETYSLFVPRDGTVNGAQPVSDLVPGAQLPGVPLHRASALVSFAHRGRIVALALQYTSANNAENLPGHITAALGAQLPLGHGVLSASAQNLLHAYTGTFTSPRYAVPLGATGAPLPTLATPLRPLWTLRYSLAL